MARRGSTPAALGAGTAQRGLPLTNEAEVSRAVQGRPRTPQNMRACMRSCCFPSSTHRAEHATRSSAAMHRRMGCAWQPHLPPPPQEPTPGTVRPLQRHAGCRPGQGLHTPRTGCRLAPLGVACSSVRRKSEGTREGLISVAKPRCLGRPGVEPSWPPKGAKGVYGVPTCACQHIPAVRNVAEDCPEARGGPARPRSAPSRSYIFARGGLRLGCLLRLHTLKGDTAMAHDRRELTHLARIRAGGNRLMDTAPRIPCTWLLSSMGSGSGGHDAKSRTT